AGLLGVELGAEQVAALDRGREPAAVVAHGGDGLALGLGGVGVDEVEAGPVAQPGEQAAAGTDGDLVPADVRDLHRAGLATRGAPAPSGEPADLARDHTDAVADRALVAGLEQQLH